MNILLTREQYLPACTLGILEVSGKKFFTIERPWIPSEAGRGGIPYQSCVPEGIYNVSPHVRASGEKSFILSNASLDVYRTPLDVPAARGKIARTQIMIHAALYVHDVIGGIGPGLTRSKSAQGEWMLMQSRDAMNQIRTLVGHTFSLSLCIAVKE